MREEVIPADDPSCKYVPAFRAGARVPYLPFSKDKSTFSYIDKVGYSILVIKTESVDTANDLASSIRDRGVPVTVSIFPDVDPTSFEGNYKRIAEILVAESILVIRPDHIIAWRVSGISAIDSKVINDVASKITGFDKDRACLKEEHDTSSDAETIRCYHRWLTREFRYSQRPYKFRFPKAIQVDNLTKETAIAIAIARSENGDRFTITTKQSAEKAEDLVLKDKPKLSGFDMQKGPQMTPM